MAIGVPLYTDWTLLPFKLACFLILPLRLILLQCLSNLQERLWINVGNTDSCPTKMAKVDLADFFLNQLSLNLISNSYTFWKPSSTLTTVIVLWTLEILVVRQRTMQSCMAISGILDGLVNRASFSPSVGWRGILLGHFSVVQSVCMSTFMLSL